MSRSISGNLIRNFNNVFDLHVHINGKPGFSSFWLFFFVFLRKLWALSFFSGRNIGHISRTKNRTKTPGFPFVGWYIINIVSNNHT